ncbi:MAG: hypothetical protein NTX64_10050 [Elusimicrobia bacterium]|nr:hypothetical protein [Elusimicrobiota bacterium]
MGMPSIGAAKSTLRSLLCAVIALAAPGIAPYQALAQTVSVQVVVPGAGSAAGAAGAATSVSRTAPMSQMTFSAPVISLTPALSPVLTPSLAVPSPVVGAASGVGAAASRVGTAASRNAAPIAGDAVVALPSAIATVRTSLAAAQNNIQARGVAVVASKSSAVAPRTTFGGLIEAAKPETTEGAAVSQTGSRLSRAFDGAGRRMAFADPVSESAAVDAGRAAAEQPTGLSPAAPKAAAGEQKTQVASPQPVKAGWSRGAWRTAAFVAAAALMLAFPAVALAAGGATAAGTVAVTAMTTLSAAQPLASAVGAGVGAIFGLIAPYLRKDGHAPNTAEIMSSVLRYGILGGAGAYVLLDLVKIPVLGLQAAGLSPLSSAVATAALGQTGFQGTFADPATSSADRIMAAFPAVAGALGITLGVLMFPAPLLSTLAVGAMTITSVAGALFSALFKPGRSPIDNGRLMAKGYVLQALFTGLALAVASPWLKAAFYAMVAWGFFDVLYTIYREIRSFWYPEPLPPPPPPDPAPAPAPAPPAK